MVKGFGRRPLRRLGVRRGRRLKASQGGSRKEDWGLFGERAYGDLRIADGWRARRRRSAIGDRRYSVFSAEAPMVGGFDGDEVRDMLTTGTSSTIAKTTGLSRQAIYRLKTIQRGAGAYSRHGPPDRARRSDRSASALGAFIASTL